MNHLIGAMLILMAAQSQAGNVLRFHNGNVDARTMSHHTQSLSASKDVFVLQYKNAITEADKKELQSQGVSIYRYVPEDALIVRASETQLVALLQNPKSSPRFNGFIAYQGSMKLSPLLPTFSVLSTGHMSPVAILTFTADDARAVLSYLRASDPNFQVLDFTGTTLSVKMSDSLIPNLAQISGVEFVQIIEKMQPMNMLLEAANPDPTPKPAGDYTDLSGFESGTKAMNFEAIWALGYHGEGQIAGMADTGLDTGNIATMNADFKGAVLSGKFYGVGSKSWEDPMGHGTHVSGSVVSRGITSGGKIKGGANQAQYFPEAMWSPLVDNLTVPPQLSTLFNDAYAAGVRVHTNSWGSARSVGVYDAMAQQVDQFMWDHPDFLIMFAAGNSGVDMDKDGKIDPNSIGSPGTAKNILTVGASENLLSVGGIQKKVSELRTAKDTWPAEPIWSSKISDNLDGVAMFSSRGPTTDGRIKPEIVAPGTNILSDRSHNPTAETLWGAYNDDYVYSGGTSMSTPLAAGAATVARQYIIKNFNIANPSAALVKATLMHTAHEMFPGQYGTGPTQELQRRPNSDEGFGRVDMAQVAQLKTAGAHLQEAAVAQDEEYSQAVQVTNGHLLANLVYTDSPGTPSAGAALVNDLSLEVSGPVGGASKVYASRDAINNNEVQELSDLPNGTYKISVKGTKIPMGKDGKQAFALVYTAH